MNRQDGPPKKTKPVFDIFSEQISAINPAKKVSVYRNLHKKCFSVKQGSRVIFHSRCIFLKNVNFRVNERIRQIVIGKKQKQVHAFVDGFICENFEITPCNFKKVYYNPYTTRTFVYEESDGVQNECPSSNKCHLAINQVKTVLLVEVDSL